MPILKDWENVILGLLLGFLKLKARGGLVLHLCLMKTMSPIKCRVIKHKKEILFLWHQKEILDELIL